MRRSIMAALLLALPLTARAAVVVSTPEGNAGLTSVQIQIVSKTPANGNITGQWQTVDGTATVADNDYVPAGGDFVILSGQTQSQPITLQVVGDTKVENDETFSLSLFNVANGAQLDGGPYTINIINDDAPAVTVTSPSAPEGNSGTTALPFVVTLTAPAAVTVQAAYATADGTAKASDADYGPDIGNLVFLPGETTKIVNINIIGDTKFEPTETFQLGVTPNGGATAVGTGTIINDDAPGVTVSDARVTEGNSGAAGITRTAMVFTVTLAALTTQTVQATVQTTDGTATAGEDYDPVSGTITFAPGTLTQTVTVFVIGDTKFEPDETFTLTVTPTGGTPVTATGTIVNDDTPPLAALRIVSGNGQSARLGKALPQPLVVEATNSQGAVVSGVVVAWSVTKGAATLSSATSTTDAQGRASITATLTSVGEVDIQAVAKGVAPVTFVFTSATQLEQHASGPVAVPVAHALDIVCGENNTTFAAACRALTALDDAALTSALERVAPQQSAAQAMVATAFVDQVNAGIQSRLRTLRGGARRFDIQKLSLSLGGRPIPIAMMSAALQSAPAPSGDQQDYNGWSAYLGGNLGTGNRVRQDGIIGFDLDTHGLMAGADRQLGDGVVGLSVNAANFTSKLNDAAGKVDTSSYAISLYGSRGGLRAGNAAPSTGSGFHYDGLHFDGSITGGHDNYDSTHVVDVPGLPLSTARSKNNAITYAMAFGGGLDAHSGRTDLELGLNASWSRTNIHNLTESGDGPLILFVQGRGVDSFLTAASVNVRSVWATSFGDLLPSFRAELLHDSESAPRLFTARFLHDPLNTPFTVPLDQPDANYGKLAAGLQAVFAHGVSAFVEVTQDVARSDVRMRTVQFNVSKSF